MLAKEHEAARIKARAALVKGLDANDRGDNDLLDRFDRWSTDLVEGLAEVYIKGPTDAHVAAVTEMLEGAVEEMQRLGPAIGPGHRIADGAQHRLGHLANVGITDLLPPERFEQGGFTLIGGGVSVGGIGRAHV